ncbi:GAP family protein [Streptomyces sp. NBC_01216]|uniref:GAP family protein n=1 Tax=Streptomyces sp. NBC_01216 TaxID=2903778 RepID=UPI002E0F62D4|nr:GAP family protein [Streptomyces sp. NBC_01216]
MGDAVGQMLVSAVGIAISPVPVIAMVLMLASPRGRADGIAFTASWMVSLAVLVTVVVTLGVGADASGAEGPATWTSWLKLALGVSFLLLAARQWRGRHRDAEGDGMPRWIRAVDSFTPAKAAGLAVVLAVANPKNLVLAVGGAVAIASSDATAGGRAVAGLLMVLIASLCALAPLTVYLSGGDRSTRVLAGWKAWMAVHNAAIMATLLVVLGGKYVGDAVSALAS